MRTSLLDSQAMVFEWQRLLSSGSYLLVAQHPGTFLAVALAGFSVNCLAILVIKLASSLTLKVRQRSERGKQGEERGGGERGGCLCWPV